MKMKFNSNNFAAWHLSGGAFCTGVVLLMVSSAQAQNLFVANQSGTTITEITPASVQSTFASGFNGPAGLAFNSAGDLFELDWGSGNIYEFTPAESEAPLPLGCKGLGDWPFKA